MLAFNTTAIAFLRRRLPPRTSGPLVEWGAFKEPTYAFMIAGMFFTFWALYFAFYYVRSPIRPFFLPYSCLPVILHPHVVLRLTNLQVGTFSRDIIGLSYIDSVNLLLVMVGVGVPARITPALIADRFTGPLNIMLPFVLLCGTMFFAWTGIKESGSLYVFASLYGIGSAGIQSLFPPALASLTGDLKKAGTRLGMGFFVVSFAVLTGPPLAGALITNADGEFLHAQIWAGCSMFLGVSLLIAARISKTGWRLRQRV